MSELVKVDFHGDVLWATRQDGEVFVAVRPICEAIDIEWSAQFRRIQRDAVLGPSVAMMATVAGDGKRRETLCIPLRLLNGWLFGIDERRVKRADVRDKIVAYKRECHAVLFAHFMPKAAPEREEPEAVDDEWDRWLRLVGEGRRVFGQRFARDLWCRPECPLPRPGADTVREPSVAEFLAALPGLPDAYAGSAWIGASDLYRTYRDWCGERGIASATQTAFGRTLAEAGAWKESRGGRLYYARAGLQSRAPEALN